MSHRFNSHWMLAAVVCLSAPVCAWAAAPGEDPVVLQKPISIQMIPMNTNKVSGYINYDVGPPADQQAKLTRYVAKAFSADTTGISTEKDVINAVQTQGSKVVCSQSVGSKVGAAAAATQPGKPAGDQIVVLRGDLVNICW